MKDLEGRVPSVDTQKIHPSLLLPQSQNIEEKLSRDYGTADTQKINKHPVTPKIPIHNENFKTRK